MFKYINNYESSLVGAITLSATSMSVSTPFSLGTGEVCRLTIQNETATSFEIVDVTAVSGATCTIQRAKEGTIAQDWMAGSVVVCSVTAEQMSQIGDIEQALDEILGA